MQKERTSIKITLNCTNDWNIETVNEEASSIYLDKVSFAWSMDSKGNIVVTPQKENYKTLLSQVDLITQNFDSTWRFIDSDDYYDWFGGLYNAARTLGAKPDTSFVDIRNQNNYVSRSYEEELDYEIRSMILNPNYYNPLVNSQAGSLSYAKNMENLYGGLILSGGKLNGELGNQIARNYNGLTGTVQSTAQAAAWQSMAAWMFYLNDQGVWDGDTKEVQQLANNIIQMANNYGVACCHHTCKNLDFNMKIIQASSLSPQEKAQYADILAQATLTDPLYVTDDAPVDGDGKSNTNPSNQEVLVNGTSENSGDASGSVGGETAVGNQPSTSSSDASSASSAQSSDSSSSQAGEDASQSSDSNAYEISKSSPAKSVSAESSMPIVVIVAIVVLVAIFMFGYTRNKDDFDDY